MPLDELEALKLDELNIAEALHVKQRIKLLKHEKHLAEEDERMRRESFNTRMMVLGVAVALLTLVVSIVRAASPSDMSIETVDNLYALCSIDAPEDGEGAVLQAQKIISEHPTIASQLIDKMTLDMHLRAGCTSYIAGYKDAIYRWKATTPSGSRICFPERGITNGQALKVFLAWATDHPEHLHRAASHGLHAAFEVAFPCY